MLLEFAIPFKGIFYNNNFRTFVNNNKDIYTNGVHIPGQYLAKNVSHFI